LRRGQATLDDQAGSAAELLTPLKDEAAAGTSTIGYGEVELSANQVRLLKVGIIPRLRLGSRPGEHKGDGCANEETDG
jgi:hypothetical protein